MATAGAEAPASAVVSPVEATPSVAGAWPDFAVVCSFLERYGAVLDLPELTFPELEEALEETGAVPKPLMELHLKLMRKIGKSVTVERWEKYMIKMCQDYNSTWAWEMEEKGYQEMSVECKVGLLKHLCECQFDDNLKFKNIINEEDGDAMRLQPIGRDKDGLMYWFQLDQEHNIRMYIEEQDDQDGSTWKCIVKSRNDLAETLELLKAQIDPALLKKNEPEESLSQEGLNPEGEEIKPENQETAKENGHLKDEKPEGEDGLEKLKTTCEDEGQANSIKMEEEEPLKTASEIKTEPASEENQIAKEECDSFKENVKPLSPELKEDKEKPKDVKDSKGSCDQVTPPREPERTEVSVIVKRTEDPVEKSTEDTEKIKNDQQAKIPLKKRELKLTDDFDSPVKTTLNKPKEALLKDGKKEDEHIKNALSLVLEGKQLVNGEINNEKTTYKGKLDLVEENSSDIKEKDDSSLKEENGISHEKQSTGVIKSLSDVIVSNKSLGTDKSELAVKSLVNDVTSPSAEKLKQKSLSGEGHDGALLKTVGINDEDIKKKAMASPSIIDKQVIEKEADNVDSSTKCSTESSLSNKTAKVCLDESNTTSDVPQKLTEECNSENKTEQNLCKSDLKNQTENKEDSEVQSKLSVPVKTSKLRPSRKAARKNSAKNRERVNAKSLQESSKELIISDTTEAAENEKSLETDKNSSSKSKHKNKSTSKESKETGTDSVVTESQLIEDGKVVGTPTTEVETSKSEAQTPVLKSKPKSKQISEDENSETEGKEMTSERQKDGLKLTIRISSKRRRGEALLLASMAREAEEAEVEESLGRSLRRSPRISRPTAKVAEIREQQPEKKQSDEEEKPVEQKPEKDEEIKPEKDPCSKLKRNKPRQRRRARWTIFRSRRKRKESSEEESEESDSEGDSEVGSEEERNKEGVPGEDDEPCKKCGLPNHPELILLCDSCDSGYHTACLRPPLMIIPDGEWFCPPCQHKVLCEKLEEQLQNLDVVLKKKERAERRKERLVYVGISIENIIPTQEVEEVPEVQEKEEKKKKKPKPLERRSTRTRKCISYRFDEFDEAIDEAIEDDIRDGDGGGGGGRGKDMSNITGHRGKDISTILEGEKIETKRPQRTVSRRKKRRRLNDLDSDSKEEEESEDDEFKISEGSQDEFVVSNEDVEESEEDQQSNDSDFGVRRPRRHYRRPVRKSRRLKRRKRKYSDDDEEEDSEEEEQEASETEASSDYSDDYLDMRRRRSRRNQKRQVNYKEDSESDGSQKGARYGRGKEMRRILKRRFSSSESNESGTEERRPGRGRPPLLRKRIRSSNDECSEDEKPVRKRLNRIETDEDEEDDTKVCEVEKPPTVDKPSATINLQESTKKPCYRIESDDDDFDNVGKDESPLDYSLVDLPSTNGQSPGKTIENLIGKPSDKSQTSKDTSANISQASNGTGSNPEAVVPEEDEDELLRVTDLVDYVCNSEQL